MSHRHHDFFTIRRTCTSVRDGRPEPARGTCCLNSTRAVASPPDDQRTHLARRRSGNPHQARSALRAVALATTRSRISPLYLFCIEAIMLKGLAITPPVVGRISIGRIVEKNGKRLPEKDDQFTLTTQVQQRGEWMLHPLNETLRKAASGKLRAIPVRMLFNDPDLNLRADYSLFDRDTGRPICVGNGETCRRAGDAGIESLPCPSPDGCALARQGGCKPYARLNVIVGDEDEMGSFIFRTTSYNSIRTLAARLHYFRAVSGNLLAGLSLELRLRGKSTTQSYRSAIYYVDLGVRSGTTLEDTLVQARELDARR
ncbi:hypothetical protein MTR_1856s0010, partial [Medicago truncatula]